MKMWMKPLGSVLVAGSLLIGGAAAPSALGINQAQAAEVTAVNVINVVGKGEVKINPDVAYLYIGVESNADTAAAAQKKTAAVMNKLSALLKTQWKIAAKDIETDQFYVSPNYTYTEKDGQKVKDYSATHTLKVTYRDLDKIGQLLDEASEAGANRIQNISFAAENPESYEADAIAKAMNSASTKAGAIAKAANRQLGAIVSISLDGADTPIVYQPYQMKNAAAETASSADSTAIDPGQITITSQLTVQYEMK
ncbi:SIMPL domain-containing protein [Saccharibacillus sp. CPCC 101409]|uniref:SIMPL domain-containing protein n=1 Tax=Saccharibacillus sp. CPCC 101409 TaxID=3058041 RepID=UPI0026714C22|nr:SIMPL domain-containing protein [Saccharibacillus sp. CPCC 101409]MDO3413105.1 SIMPL domain-containing protein [Saccharibacillus sp. CPCC 101409]